MKKLYRKGTVHPSQPDKLDQLTFLPAAILTLAAALSPEEKEVLAYLISCSNSSGNCFSNHHRLGHQSGSSSSFARSYTTGSGDHPPSFKCDCFRCYMSYWARWDSSPNLQLIHEIIEAFEDWLVQSSTSSKKSRKDRKKKGSDSNKSSELNPSETSQNSELGESDSVIESSSGGGDGGGGSGGGGGDAGEGGEKGSVRRLMNFIGERIWGVGSST
ncbi:hypothetical protein HS088_TW21G00701 [Tripterygium wilfordii]|uniref:Uncharacterized protein n=2 Tax=Tripterygium wilfordii TaxID=458696 RepID=A0A7J7C360_TRIWF|nr:hypothetical protein HS088_TW21G00701 [Tripterygium wilfordii]